MFLAAAIDAVYAYFMCVCLTYKTRLNKPDEEEKKEEEPKKEEEKKEEEKKEEPEMMMAAE
jgi:ribosomal protein L12E/L44/L45/RPP1/RPP2